MSKYTKCNHPRLDQWGLNVCVCVCLCPLCCCWSLNWGQIGVKAAGFLLDWLVIFCRASLQSILCNKLTSISQTCWHVFLEECMDIRTSPSTNKKKQGYSRLTMQAPPPPQKNPKRWVCRYRASSPQRFCLCSVWVVYTLRKSVPDFLRGNAGPLHVDSLVSDSHCFALKQLEMRKML